MEQNERKYIGDICYIQLNSGGVLTRISDGASIKLSATEYKILFYFISNKNQDLALEQIANYIWGSGHEKDADSIKSQITRIRSKLDQIRPGLGKKCIVTNRGFNTYTMRIDPDLAIAAEKETVPIRLREDSNTETHTAITRALTDEPIPITFEDFSISGSVFFCGLVDDDGEDLDEPADNFLLDENFEEQLASHNEGNQSPLEKKIEMLKGKKYMASLEKHINIASMAFEPVDVALCGSISGKQFNYPNLPGIRTMIFEVYSTYDYRSKSRYLSLRQLDSLESADRSYTTYFWDQPDPHYMLVLLPFWKDEAGGYEVYINNAIIRQEKIKVFKQPTFFRFQSWYLPAEINLDDNTYDKENMTEEVRRKLLEETLPREAKWAKTDLRRAPAMVIDPENLTPVLREVYFDEEEQQLKARMKIVPYKGYFVFRVCDDSLESPCTPLQDVELGYLYRYGLHGFPKDLLLAIRHLEKDGSPNSIYQIAGIFATEEELQDEELYLEYLQMAADLGAESAIAELAEYRCRKGDPASVRKAKELFDKIADQESTAGNFLYACCMEKGLLGSVDPETVFDCYFKAACNEYQPAMARLRCRYSDLENPDVLYAYFRDSLETGTGNVDYCLGSMYFYGYGLYPRKQEGIRLLREATERGDPQAAYAVFDILDKGREYQDQAELLKWLMELEKPAPFVLMEISNRLLDGVGCVCSQENDAVAFELLQKAADAGNQTAVSNLGWMYKKGRGCRTDYAKAVELFEKAGTANSYFHLGDMHEKGLGVTANLEKAVDLYEAASSKGSKKAKRRLAEIRATEEKQCLTDIAGRPEK